MNSPAADQPEQLFEQPTRLSQSRIWEMQRGFYSQHGADAWRQSIVPHYVTSNPFIARCCAQQVHGIFADLNTHGIDSSQPIYIVELGAGCGRFAFHFLTEFLKRISGLRTVEGDFCYVMTDHAEKTIEYWQQHDQLTPFVQQGQLDYCQFDIGHSNCLTLKHRGQTLAAGQIANPIIVLANYLFDSLPHDAYRIQDGRLHECLVGLRSSAAEPDSAKIELDQVDPVYDYRPIDPARISDPRTARILESYRDNFGDTHVLIPAGAFGCLDDLQQLSHRGLFVIAADMGQTNLRELERQPPPKWNVHGSISMTVNFDAIARYADQSSGFALTTPPHAGHLTVSTIALGALADDLPCTRQAFQEAFTEPGPDAFYTLMQQLERITPFGLSFEEIDAHLKLSGMDVKVFQTCFKRLQELISAGLTPVQEERLYAAIESAWDGYFAVVDSTEMPFHFGRLLHQMGYFPEALKYFDRALTIWGPTAQTFHHMGLCHFGLRELDRAESYFHQAAEMDPSLKPPHGMLERIHSIRSRSQGE